MINNTFRDMEVNPIPVEGDAIAKTNAIIINSRRADLLHQQEDLRRYYQIGEIWHCEAQYAYRRVVQG